MLSECWIDPTRLPENSRDALIRIAERHNALIEKTVVIRQQLYAAIGSTDAEQQESIEIFEHARQFWRSVKYKYDLLFILLILWILSNLAEKLGIKPVLDFSGVFTFLKQLF
jgi:hypothetical protein